MLEQNAQQIRKEERGQVGICKSFQSSAVYLLPSANVAWWNGDRSDSARLVPLCTGYPRSIWDGEIGGQASREDCETDATRCNISSRASRPFQRSAKSGMLCN